MRKTVSRVLLIALALGLCGSSIRFAYASQAAGAEANPNQTRKAYLKHQKKMQNKFKKDAKRQQKEIKKQHEA